jgi:hypothetical protein
VLDTNRQSAVAADRDGFFDNLKPRFATKCRLPGDGDGEACPWPLAGLG